MISKDWGTVSRVGSGYEAALSGVKVSLNHIAALSPPLSFQPAWDLYNDNVVGMKACCCYQRHNMTYVAIRTIYVLYAFVPVQKEKVWRIYT